MTESDVQQEREDPQEHVQPSAEDPAAPEPSPKTERAVKTDRIKEILDKMPVEDKETLQRDYGTIQYINITYQGNYTENSGTIYGNISQQQGEPVRSGSSPVSAGTIQDFFRPDARLDALAALLTLATLESVQENLFHAMIPRLSQRLRQGREPSENEESGSLAYLRTADELLAPFRIQRKALPFTYGDAELTLQCLVFCDSQFPSQVRELAWRMYPQLRPMLMDWLLDFQTRTADAADRALAYAATRGLAVYASLDAEYACHNIIPLLEERCARQADVKYLVTFFGQFMQMENCRMVGDEILRRWCGRKSGFLWQVPYQLYSGRAPLRFCEAAPEALRKCLQRDCEGLGRFELKWYQQNRGYFLYPAHRNVEAAALLAREIGRCFSGCKDFQARYQMAVYFLVLFRWDYLTDFSSAPELSFLRCFHEKEPRNALLPVFQFIWRHVELRNTMRQVLSGHFADIYTHGASAVYLERPMTFLAFTGSRIDYQNTIKLLKDCARQEEARPAAEHLTRYLTECLQQRAARSRAGE